MGVRKSHADPTTHCAPIHVNVLQGSDMSDTSFPPFPCGKNVKEPEAAGTLVIRWLGKKSFKTPPLQDETKAKQNIEEKKTNGKTKHLPQKHADMCKVALHFRSLQKLSGSNTNGTEWKFLLVQNSMNMLEQKHTASFCFVFLFLTEAFVMEDFNA